MDFATTRHEISVVTDAQQAATLLDEILPVYAEVFAEPPYNEGPDEVDGFLRYCHRERRAPGFRLALLRDGHGTLSAFAYGLLLSARTSWWDDFLDTTLPEEFVHEDGRRTFVIKELAVQATYRRQGIGRALHAALIDGTSAERITLAVRPEAIAATSLYSTLGYELVGPTRPDPDAPTYHCMIARRTDLLAT